MPQQIADEEVILLYRDTIRPLYAYVSRRVGGDRGLAEDLVQETWMKALGDWPRNGIPDDPLAWLVRVGLSVLVSHFRRVSPRLADPVDLDKCEALSGDPDVAAALGWGMARLGPGQAEILEAFYFEGKTVREIAEEFSTSERAVEGRLRRAKSNLRAEMEKVCTSTRDEFRKEKSNVGKTPT